MAKESKVNKLMQASYSDEEDFQSSDDEIETKVHARIKTKIRDLADHDESSDDFEEEDGPEIDEEELDDDHLILGINTEVEGFEDEEEDQEEHEEEIADNEEILGKSQKESKASKKLGKLKNLTPEQLMKEQKRIKKTGVCYISRVPPYMKPAKLRTILSRFGEIDRLFLKPEDTKIYQKRVKYGGNKKKNFTEGWVEFVSKKDAKLCEASLNGQIIGGKKTSYYYDDVMNIKYLSGFKWMDLTQQIAKENEMRQSKLSMEISQQQKLNKNFIANVEKSKMIQNIQKKRKSKEEQVSSKSDNKDEDKPIEIRRNFKQRKLNSTRADADENLKEKSRPNQKLNDVLSKVF
ncbi:pre-rRNA-processing protein Esf2p [[Candida] railenensis]|uniref:Pre-rRNA-processing protein ESF2 n=1 Tax=[Candida] railenensis TaxID=45579 RepID=A0A9P0QPY8_9ASCO|nr:pre-rRNA-processing protein Esf2p [[Candida] railenensis]